MTSGEASTHDSCRAGFAPAEERRLSKLDLTATEHDLLCALARNAAGVCSYDDLARLVWRRKHVDPKLVRAFVRRLRGKLGDDAAKPVYILTERGVGYRMAAPPDR